MTDTAEKVPIAGRSRYCSKKAKGNFVAFGDIKGRLGAVQALISKPGLPASPPQPVSGAGIKKSSFLNPVRKLGKVRGDERLGASDEC